MNPTEERRVKRLLRRILGLRQGLGAKHGGGRLKAFCQATQRSYSAAANKLNLGRHDRTPGKGLAVVDIGFLVDVCRWTRDHRPALLLARMVTGVRRRLKRRQGLEAAA